MTDLMLTILPIWFLALFLGVAAVRHHGARRLRLRGLRRHSAGGGAAAHRHGSQFLPDDRRAPLFILMGNIMNTAGITDRIFRFATRGGRVDARRPVSRQHPGEHDLPPACRARRWADAGGVGTIEIKAMRDEGYDAETAAAITRRVGDDRAYSFRPACR